MTVKCPVCGTEYEDGTMFCGQDGAELPQPEPDMSAPAEEVEGSEPTAVEEPQAGPTAAPAASGAGSATAKLVVTRGAQPGKEYALFAGENEIGRWDDEAGYTPHVDLADQDMERYVHRRHAMIRFDGEQWWLEHLHEAPSNPTMIRGQGERLQVGEPVRLEDGDEIVVARVILKFVTE